MILLGYYFKLFFILDCGLRIADCGFVGTIVNPKSEIDNPKSEILTLVITGYQGKFQATVQSS
jgi:hypothetical protein